jgi:hypothetical protein
MTMELGNDPFRPSGPQAGDHHWGIIGDRQGDGR